MMENKLFANIKHDFLAGIVVFLVALPLCLGVALASGAPLFSGLIAGMVGGMIVSLFSNSQLSVSGPAAGLTAIVLSSLDILGSYEAFLLAVVIAGFIQFILGILRAGAIANYIPSNVIKGMLSAIGIILILKQLPHFFGFEPQVEGIEQSQESLFGAVAVMFYNIHWGAVIIGLVSAFILILWERPFMKKLKIVPAPLVVVMISILLSHFFVGMPSSFALTREHLVNIPINKDLPDFLDQFVFPDFSGFGNFNLWKIAVTIAIVASIESLLSLEAVDKIDPQKRHSSTSKELKAQGIGNVISGMIGGLPVTSVIVRSSVNIQAGGKTKTSAFLHGLFLLLSALFIPKVLNLIPLAALAAILIITGYKLAKVQIFKEVFAQGWKQFIPFAVTILAIIFTDLLIGIAIGLAVSTFHILQSSLYNGYFFKKEHYTVGEVISLELSEDVSFLSRAPLLLTLENIPKRSKLVLDASRTAYIDPDVVELIKEFKDIKAPAREIQLNLIGFKNKYESFNNVSFVNAPTKTSQSSLLPDDVLKILKDGNERFITNRRNNPRSSHLIHITSRAQFPHAAILGCIDSRTTVEMIFDQNIGDVFTMRIAGNVVNTDIVASMEYACKIAGAKLIVVLGHTNCGAVKGACDDIKEGHLEELFNKIKPAIDAELVTQSNRNSSNPDFVNNVTLLNIFSSMKKIREMSTILDTMITNNQIAIVGGLYNVETGKVTFYEEAAIGSIKMEDMMAQLKVKDQ